MMTGKRTTRSNKETYMASTPFQKQRWPSDPARSAVKIKASTIAHATLLLLTARFVEVLLSTSGDQDRFPAGQPPTVPVCACCRQVVVERCDTFPDLLRGKLEPSRPDAEGVLKHLNSVDQVWDGAAAVG